MKLNLSYDSIDKEWYVSTPNLRQPLREFYIQAREDEGITYAKLASDSGLERAQLRNYEFVQKTGKFAQAPGPLLAALDTLGFTLSIEG